WKNRPHLGEWETAVADNTVPAIEVEHLLPRQRAGELTMLLLRLARGINFSDFSARTNLDPRQLWSDQIARFSSAGLLEVTDTALRLSERGIAVADAVAAEFLL